MQRRGGGAGAARTLGCRAVITRPNLRTGIEYSTDGKLRLLPTAKLTAEEAAHRDLLAVLHISYGPR